MGFMDKLRHAREHAKWFAAYDVHTVNKGVYSYLPKGKFQQVKKPIAGAVAEFESGAASQRSTVGRVVAGAVIAGPVGAVVGGMLKKEKGRAYVYVTFPDGDVIIVDGPIKDESKLRDFELKVNAAAKHYS